MLDGAQFTQQLIFETVEEELDGIAVIVFVVGIVTCKLGSYCLSHLTTFQMLMLLHTRNHFHSHSGIGYITYCIQSAVLQVGTNLVPENMQVVMPFECRVKSFDAAGT